MKTTFLKLLLFLLVSLSGKAQEFAVTTKSWGVKDGLTNRHVNKIIEDKSGFIWLGTRSGLQRFDGSEFRTWSPKTGFPAFGDIRQLFIDDKGWLWCWDHTSKSYLFIHTVTEQIMTQSERFGNKFPYYFSADFKQKEPYFFQIKDPTNKLFAINSRAPFHLQTYHSSEGFKKIPLKLPAGVSKIEIVVSDHDGFTVYTEGKQKMLIKISFTGRVLQLKNLINNSTWGYPYAMYAQEKLVLHEILNGNKSLDPNQIKVWTLNWKTNSLQLRKQPFSQRTLITNDIHYLIRDNFLEFWRSDKLIHAENLATQGKEMEDTYPQFIDRNGQLWLAGSFGFSRVTLKQALFHSIAKNTINTPLPFNTSARGLVVRNDTLFAVFEFNGIAAIPLKNPKQFIPLQGSFSPHAHYYGGFALLSTQRALYIARSGMLTLIGKRNQDIPISGYDEKRKKIRKLNPHVSIHSLANTDTTFWIGSTDGLYVINSKGKGRYYKVGKRTENPIRAIVKHEKYMYLCTEEGLFRFNRISRKIEQIFPGNLKSRAYTCMYIQHSNRFFFGTNEGLLIWNPLKNTIHELNEVNGLSQKNVTGVFPGKNNELWVATFYGLNRINLKTNLIESFYESDGINHDEFNYHSGTINAGNQILFGGLNGIVVIQLNKNRVLTKAKKQLHITFASCFSEDAKKEKNISGWLRSKMYWNYQTKDRYIKIKFAIPNQNNPSETLFAWKIENLHKSWNYQKENFVQLASLPYGKNTLLIKGSLEQGEWTNPIRIVIYMERPFYLKWWFILSCAMFLFASVVFIFRRRTNNLRKKEIQLKTEIEAATFEIKLDKELIQKQADDLRQLDIAKTRFFTNITHELKTPLSLIKGPLSSIQLSKKLDEENGKLLDTAQRNTEQLLQLVNTLLDLSKLESGVLKLEEISVNLFDFSSVLLSHFQSNMDQVGIHLKFTFDGARNLTVYLDNKKCNTILNNLLSNALKFTKSGGTIHLEFKDEGDHLLFVVSDTGRGIAKENLDLIFNRFYQVSTDGGTEEGGTGIGLSLCKELVKVMNGSLEVESELGVGSTFRLRLPKIVQNDVVNTQYSIQQSSIKSLDLTANSKSSNEHILIVEDNIDLQHYLVSVIKNQGFSTSSSFNGKKAFEYLDSLSDNELPNLILSDIMMPEMDGYELLESLRSNERYWNIPVIILTARSELQDKLKALRIGVDDYLLKPFEPEELVARLINLLTNATHKKSIEPNEDEAYNESYSPADLNWLMKLESFVDLHYQEEELDVTKMYLHFAMSSSSFLRKVKGLTGMTPVHYLRESRLVKARRFLENKEFSTVSEIAYAVGFSNAKSFSRSFKTRFGKLPGDYL